MNKIFNEAAVIVLPPGDTGAAWLEFEWSDWAKLEPKEGESVMATVKRLFKLPEIIKVTDYGGMPSRQVKLSRRAIYKRDNFTCQYCNQKLPMSELSLDHVLPRAQGGKTEWENMVVACFDCNLKKGNRTPDEARMRLLTKPRMPEYDILQGRTIRVDSWQHFLGDMYWEVPLTD